MSKSCATVTYALIVCALGAVFSGLMKENVIARYHVGQTMPRKHKVRPAVAPCYGHAAGKSNPLNPISRPLLE
jgi:hypothetical protein